MCDWGIGIGVAATLMSAYSARQMGMYNQKVAARQVENNKVAAKDALRAGREEQALVRERAARIAGQQRAALAAGGVDIGSGSALDILSGTAWQAELDSELTWNNAQRKAYLARIGAANAASAGNLAGMEARGQMYGSLLSGAGDAWAQYRALKKT